MGGAPQKGCGQDRAKKAHDRRTHPTSPSARLAAWAGAYRVHRQYRIARASAQMVFRTKKPQGAPGIAPWGAFTGRGPPPGFGRNLGTARELGGGLLLDGLLDGELAVAHRAEALGAPGHGAVVS